MSGLGSWPRRVGASDRRQPARLSPPPLAQEPHDGVVELHPLAQKALGLPDSQVRNLEEVLAGSSVQPLEVNDDGACFYHAIRRGLSNLGVHTEGLDSVYGRIKNEYLKHVLGPEHAKMDTGLVLSEQHMRRMLGCPFLEKLPGTRCTRSSEKGEKQLTVGKLRAAVRDRKGQWGCEQMAPLAAAAFGVVVRVWERDPEGKLAIHRAHGPKEAARAIYSPDEPRGIVDIELDREEQHFQALRISSSKKKKKG